MNIFIGIVLIVVGIVICVLGWDAVIIVSTDDFRLLGTILIFVGTMGICGNSAHDFVKQFFPDNLLLSGFITSLPFALVLVFFLVFMIPSDGIIDKIIERANKNYHKNNVVSLSISTKNMNDIVLEKDNKKKIITNKTAMDIDKEDYTMFISIEYDADRELDSLIEMVDYVFDNDDKICTMILENLAVNSLEVDAFLLLEVTIYCKYIELCCCVGLFDTIDFKLDWETKELVRI